MLKIGSSTALMHQSFVNLPPYGGRVGDSQAIFDCPHCPHGAGEMTGF